MPRFLRMILVAEPTESRSEVESRVQALAGDPVTITLHVDTTALAPADPCSSSSSRRQRPSGGQKNGRHIGSPLHRTPMASLRL